MPGPLTIWQNQGKAKKGESRKPKLGLPSNLTCLLFSLLYVGGQIIIIQNFALFEAEVLQAIVQARR